MQNSEASWSDGPGGDLFKELGMDDSALRLIWPGTFEELDRMQLKILDSIALGAGASAVVIIARDLVAQRKVAVKIYIDPKAQGNVERFKIEARVLSSDTLPAGLVPFLYTPHEGSQLTAGAPSQPFLVMEYIVGLKIADYARENKLSVARRIQLIVDLFHQLKLLHECNLVHGDLSKNNVLGQSGDAVRLIDFGSARRRNSAIASSMSLSGPAGTFRFMPEDVLTGKAKADATSDVFGASAIAFLLLTDEVYDAQMMTPDAIRQRLVRAGAPSAIADLIMRGLREGDSADRSVGARFESATEVVAELERWRLSCERRRRARQQSLFVTALLLPLVALTAAAWWQVGELRRTQSQHEVALLEQELAGLPNRDHPAIRDALKRADEERANIRQLELAGDSREATTRRQQLADRLRHIRDVSHRIERLVPERLAYGEQLHKWPWIKAAPTIQAELKTISEQYTEIGQRLDAGDVDEASKQLVEFVRQLARLVEANVAAGVAEKSRSVYTQEELSVSERIRNHEGFAPVRKLAVSAGQAWEAGQFSEADKLFGQARQIMVDVLPTVEDPQEKQQRETKLATRLREELDRLTQQLGELRGEKDSLGEKVRSLEGQIAKVTGLGASDREALKGAQAEVETLKGKNKAGSELLQQLRDQIATLEPKAKQLDTIQKVHGNLVSDLAKVTGERDELQRKLTNAQQQVSILTASGRGNGDTANAIDVAARVKKLQEEIDALNTSDLKAAQDALNKAVGVYQATVAQRDGLLKEYRPDSPTVKAVDVRLEVERKLIASALGKRDQAENALYEKIAQQISELANQKQQLLEQDGLLPTSARVKDIESRMIVLGVNQKPYQAGHDRVTKPTVAEDPVEIVLKTSNSVAPESSVAPRKPGDRLLVSLGAVELPFRWCPGGTAKIGSPTTEKDRDSDEDQVEVTLDGFYMAETEFTQKQFQVVMGRPADVSEKFGKGPDYPVYNVTYDDCIECAAKATALALKQKSIPATAKIVLPTEAQSEYATRAGTTVAYSFGADVSRLDQHAWYDGNAQGTTHPVGKKQPNPWGLHDVHGNVWERVSDWYSEKRVGGKEPLGPSVGSLRVSRGGSWNDSPRNCRSANRGWSSPDFRYLYLGFRVALIVSGQESVGGTR